MLLWYTWQSDLSHLGLHSESIRALMVRMGWPREAEVAETHCICSQEAGKDHIESRLQSMEWCCPYLVCVFLPPSPSLYIHVLSDSGLCQFGSFNCNTYTVVLSSRFQCLVTGLSLVHICAEKINMGCFPRCQSRPHTSSIVIVGMKGTYGMENHL